MTFQHVHCLVFDVRMMRLCDGPPGAISPRTISKPPQASRFDEADIARAEWPGGA